ncbi:MAG: methyltransferase domain-containing protein [Chloroflexi bacterium]|nr:methyltransferase domain-containing protein [Chloroflexota bacterium]
MADIERFLAEKMHPVYRAHYALWVYWWPLWRSLYSARGIMRHWHRYNLVQEGLTFLDYGCGAGSFSIPAARIVGTRGKVYALDCFPRQLEMVREKSVKEGLSNVATILSDQATALPDESIDVAWMCDVLHELPEKQAVLQELRRVLKPGGVLAIYDGMKERILDHTSGLFVLTRKDGKFYRFVK